MPLYTELSYSSVNKGLWLYFDHHLQPRDFLKKSRINLFYFIYRLSGVATLEFVETVTWPC